MARSTRGFTHDELAGADLAYEEQRIRELAAQRPTGALVAMVFCSHYDGGRPFIRCTGYGYPVELGANHQTVQDAIDCGYEIRDPDGLLHWLHDDDDDALPFDGSSAPRDTREPESVSELDRDSAGYGY